MNPLIRGLMVYGDIANGVRREPVPIGYCIYRDNADFWFLKLNPPLRGPYPTRHETTHATEIAPNLTRAVSDAPREHVRGRN